MDLSNLKSRSDLTAYFKKNNIPTEANFQNFIGSTLNQKEDGITRPSGDAICIGSSVKQDHKPVLHLWENLENDPTPSWTISLASVSKSRGFAISNVLTSGLNTRIFIESATGNIGIGTVMPTETLHVAGSAQITGATKLGSTLDVTGAVRVNAGVTVDGAVNARTSSISETMTAGNATVTNTLSAAAVSVTNALSAGSATIAGAANAASANVSGALSAGTATVTNTLTAGNVTVNGAAMAQSAIVNGALQVVSIMAQSANAVADLPLAGKSSGIVRAKTAFVAESTLDVTGKLTANAAVDAKSTLDVAGKLTASGVLDVSGALTAKSTLEIMGAVSAKSKLDVTGKLTATGGLDVQSTARTNPNNHPMGRPLYVTGDLTDTIGIEFRTSDAKQGIGFGPTTMYAAGTNDNQDLNLKAKGTGAVVLGNVKIGSSNTTATSIVDTIGATMTDTTLPTSKAVRDLVNQTMPIGSIIMWSGGTSNPKIDMPTGWALCDGNNGTPDLRNRFVLGKGTQNVGATGGSATVTLTTDQIPAHSHGASTGNAGSHNHTTTTGHPTKGNISYYGSGNENLLGSNDSTTTGAAGDHSHSVTVSNTGGGAAHDNMPPYYVLAYIMRVS